MDRFCHNKFVIVPNNKMGASYNNIVRVIRGKSLDENCYNILVHYATIT